MENGPRPKRPRTGPQTQPRRRRRRPRRSPDTLRRRGSTRRRVDASGVKERRRDGASRRGRDVDVARVGVSSQSAYYSRDLFRTGSVTDRLMKTTRDCAFRVAFGTPGTPPRRLRCTSRSPSRVGISPPNGQPRRVAERPPPDRDFPLSSPSSPASTTNPNTSSSSPRYGGGSGLGARPLLRRLLSALRAFWTSPPSAFILRHSSLASASRSSLSRISMASSRAALSRFRASLRSDHASSHRRFASARATRPRHSD